MIIKPIRTRILVPPQDDLLQALSVSLPTLPERSILAVTSKVVSIWEGKCVAKGDVGDRDGLIRNEAEKYLPRELVPGGWVIHTIKHNLFIPTAGIDESNAGEYYILWPKNPLESAKRLFEWARERYGVAEFGILITDSHSIPLRRGVVGISLASYGFNPLFDYRDEHDLFGREFKMTLMNIADGLAAAATVMMGEGAEQTPAAIIRDLPHVSFGEHFISSKKPHSSFAIPEEEDIYRPFLMGVPWEKGGDSKKI